jgi:hypothetical protein
MYSILLRKTTYSFALLFIITLVIWFVPSLNDNTEYTLLQTNVSPSLALIISYIIVFGTSLLVNKTLEKSIFGNENSNAFILFFVSVCSLSTGFSELIVLSALNFIFSTSVIMILRLDEHNAVKNLFNSTFVLGGLSFLFVLFIPFVYLVLIGASYIRRLKISDVLIMTMSFLLPAFIAYLLAFITDNYWFFNSFFNFKLISPVVNSVFYVVAPFIVLFSVMGMFALRNNRTFAGTKNIKAINVIVFLFIFSCLLGVVNLFLYPSLAFFMCISLGSAVYIASFFLKSEFQYKTIVLFLFMSICFISKYFM